jgi:shikimate 5-dehydrogenase
MRNHPSSPIADTDIVVNATSIDASRRSPLHPALNPQHLVRYRLSSATDAAHERPAAGGWTVDGLGMLLTRAKAFNLTAHAFRFP